MSLNDTIDPIVEDRGYEEALVLDPEPIAALTTPKQKRALYLKSRENAQRFGESTYHYAATVVANARHEKEVTLQTLEDFVVILYDKGTLRMKRDEIPLLKQTVRTLYNDFLAELQVETSSKHI